jgi:hypothetical protein
MGLSLTYNKVGQICQKNAFFFLAKHVSIDVNLKNRLIENRL